MTRSSSTQRPLYISYAGPILLETPLLNKGSAFTEEERRLFNLEGLLPQAIETIEQQTQRAYQQFSGFHNDLDKHIYLRNIQDANETLFYRLIVDHLQEMMPIIYTPTVGRACQLFSRIYRRKRGLFLAYPNRNRIEEILHNATKQNIKVIVMTDSERILGLGDQGVGGMGIPIGKLSLYSACGGISPAYTLPVTLDVGTNNTQLLDDPMYMGWRHERIAGEEYFNFVDRVMTLIKRQWPRALIQFEDFAQATATPLLKKYQSETCCFNDDIQGTAAVTVATLLAACRVRQTALKDQNIVFIGAGSAGCGIAEQIVSHMCAQGLPEHQARERMFMFNKEGLLTDATPHLLEFQKRFAHRLVDLNQWLPADALTDPEKVIRASRATILIGVSGQPGLMTQSMIEAISEICPRPIVLPLSNPTSQIEALPENIIQWSCGRAIVATGSPFEPVIHRQKTYPIAQCNNSYIFPGIGLGVIASGANRISEQMFMAASEVLAEHSPAARGDSEDLLPSLVNIRQVSRFIAEAVGLQAMEEGFAKNRDKHEFSRQIEKNFWNPVYRYYRRTSF